ncbi:hypothetical protein L2E82_31294 [Cichorium intybus]|uniref:Uncharacterized protein n=1 Tax=Cichorium intybus TaxID=13427 RepID=A0ACB9D2R4_CICIN|nr:hypothetical protein L2E82_31294 [Cichorium intybus]
MAYHDDGYMWPQEHATYDLFSYHDPVSFSGYESHDLHTYDAYTVSEFQEPKVLDHYHHAQDYDYDYDHNSFSSVSPGINYFAYNYVEPKLIAYEPVTCDTGYVSYHTQYSISYMNLKPESRFNEPEFEEYDPTPYDGGYDIVSVYGKPLPPSDKTCYPRSNPKPVEPKSEPVSNPIPLVNHKPEPEHKVRSQPEPEPVHVPVLMAPPLVEPEPEPEHVNVPVPMAEPLELTKVGETEKQDCDYPDYRFDYLWPEYDHGYGIGVGYDYGYVKQVVQVPPFEYNPEVVDLCENIFGSWPCLARIRKQQMGIDNNPGITSTENGHLDPWEECASYIFGRPIASYNG